ncbi:hypothetical protein [Thalassospira sp.]|uniref:hypothetical protein n=1 Tax=Thalassospira sp. TaxID=1912094 RepID=UPI002736FC99|nr:hypothetical protein [Thalassospira sp.]MDP2696631.1 hypothetical protein [Thalassospira sp.]
MNFYNKFRSIFILSVFIGFFIITTTQNSYAKNCSDLKYSTFKDNFYTDHINEMYDCASDGDDYFKSYLQGLFFSGMITVSSELLDFLRSPVDGDNYSLLKSYLINASRVRDEKDAENSIKFLMQSAKNGNPYAGYLSSARYLYEDGDLADIISHFSYNYGHRYGLFFFSIRSMLQNGCYKISRAFEKSIEKGLYFDPHFVNFLHIFKNNGCDIGKMNGNEMIFFHLPIDDYIISDNENYDVDYEHVDRWIEVHSDLNAKSPLNFCSGDGDYTCKKFAFYDDFYCRAILSVGDKDISVSPEYEDCRENFLRQHK